MKKFVATCLVASMLGMNIAPVLAVESQCSRIKDVTENYWAKSSIETVTADSIMSLDDCSNFNPDKEVSRAEFVSALLKVLRDDKVDVSSLQNKYSDISVEDTCYNDVLRSDSLGLVYGYPDGTFKPSQAMLRSECVSVISHITNDTNYDVSVLDRFADKQDIPTWSKEEYAKTISYGIYVNYPDADKLEPNRTLTRAECAVILTLLKLKLNCVKPQYVGEVESLLGTEHLSVCDKAPNNIVKITNLRKVVNKGNVIVVAFDEKFASKKHKAGDVVNFVVPEALYTDEGTMLLPQGTKIVAEVTRIVSPKKFNKNARVHLVYKTIVLPDGRSYSMCGKPFTKDGTLKEGPWMTFWKLFGSTVTLGIVGAGAGTGFAFIPNPAKLGVGFAIGIPVGCTVGLITGLLTPGLHYRAKKGEQVMVILLDDASINNK
jgi:hypothetical protein